MARAFGEEEILPKRLNMEPPVYRGCSISELMMLGGISAAVCVPSFILILAFFGYAMMGLGIGCLASIGGIVLGARLLQKMKRGRPEGYYQLQIALAIDKLGIKKLGIVRNSGFGR